MERGRSSGVEHNLAKVGVEGSNPFARSSETADFRHELPADGAPKWHELAPTGMNRA